MVKYSIEAFFQLRIVGTYGVDGDAQTGSLFQQLSILACNEARLASPADYLCELRPEAMPPRERRL